MVYCENAFHCQRFFPSEFANEAERCQAVEPMKTVSAIKSKIQQMIAAEKIPYTIVCSNCFSGFHLPTLAQTGASGPPRERVIILGDGNPKGTRTFFIHNAFMKLN